MPTILVIDDEECIRSLIADVMEGSDCRVLAAADGITGVECALRQDADLILLDRFMPGESGDEVLRRLRADPATATIPVVLMSGLAPDQTASSAAGLAAAYLMKPFSPAELRETVDAVLAPPALRARAAVA